MSPVRPLGKSLYLGSKTVPVLEMAGNRAEKRIDERKKDRGE